MNPMLPDESSTNITSALQSPTTTRNMVVSVYDIRLHISSHNNNYNSSIKNSNANGNTLIIIIIIIIIICVHSAQ